MLTEHIVLQLLALLIFEQHVHDPGLIGQGLAQDLAFSPVWRGAWPPTRYYCSLQFDNMVMRLKMTF